MMRSNGDFLKDLRREIDETQERRDEFIKQKFFYVIGLFGVGSINIGDINLYSLFYIVPIVAYAFDMFVIGEEFRVRRAGAFFSKPTTKAPENEKEWEEFVGRHRDPFYKKASALLSFIVLLGSALAIASETSGKLELLYYFWIILNFMFIIGLLKYKKYLKDLCETIKKTN